MKHIVSIITNLTLGTAAFAMESPQQVPTSQESSMVTESMEKETARKVLAQQIPHVKTYLQNIDHPRLILGVGNTETASGNPGVNPFLNNPTDILADMSQDLDKLQDRTLTFNFENLDELNQLAEAFPNTFDVITADFFVTKYAATWTKEHLGYLKKMLKSGGMIVLPIDQQSSSVSMSKEKTKKDLFESAAAEMNLKNDRLHISQNGVSFAFLPDQIAAGIEVTPEEIDNQYDLYKKLAPDFDYSPIVGNRQATNAKRRKVDELAQKLGIIGYFMNLPEDIKSGQKKLLEDEEELKGYIKYQLLREKQDIEKKKLKDEFMINYVIPMNLKRITAEVFDSNKIVIDKNLPLPQPHREKIYSGFAIIATK